MERKSTDTDFIEQRLKDISEGLKEAIRREVERLKQLGIPLYVGQNGKVVVIQPEKNSRSKSR